MKKHKLGIVGLVGIILTVVLFLAMIASAIMPIGVAEKAKNYFCDVKVFSLALHINVEDESERILYSIDGEYFHSLEDNLAMKDAEGTIVREMRDDFNFVTQNDHAITDGKNVKYIMEGNLKLFGDSYKIFTPDKKQIATLECNMFMTSCLLKDMKGNVIAEYRSRFPRKDYVVSIYDECAIDDKSVLLFFASAYSDNRADAESSNN